jgi:putative endonuclease
MAIDTSQRSWFVYVLRNPDGKLYIGQTDNISHRLHQHNDPTHTLTRTTKRFRGPWQLVYSEAATSRSAALAREKALKSGQGRAWLKKQIGC